MFETLGFQEFYVDNYHEELDRKLHAKVFRMETRRMLCQRGARIYRPVTGKDAAAQKTVATAVGGKLKIPVEIAVRIREASQIDDEK